MLKSDYKNLHEWDLVENHYMQICNILFFAWVFVVKKKLTNGLQNCLLQEILIFIHFQLIEDILDKRILIWEKFEAGVNAATQKGQKADVTKGSPTSIFRVA